MPVFSHYVQEAPFVSEENAVDLVVAVARGVLWSPQMAWARLATLVNE